MRARDADPPVESPWPRPVAELLESRLCRQNLPQLEPIYAGGGTRVIDPRGLPLQMKEACRRRCGARTPASMRGVSWND
jgi:hypothetical protein